MDFTLLSMFIIGALGALMKDILKDNQLTLPKCSGGNFSLGFIGGMIIGGAAGYLVDTDPVTAFLAGYAGSEIIENLIAKKNSTTKEATETTEELIRKIATKEQVDQELAVAVAKCESGLNCLAVNTNTDGSRDRELYQINEKWHTDISDEDAFNPITATEFFCKAYKEGHLSWWDASKNCWGKKAA